MKQYILLSFLFIDIVNFATAQSTTDLNYANINASSNHYRFSVTTDSSRKITQKGLRFYRNDKRIKSHDIRTMIEKTNNSQIILKWDQYRHRRAYGHLLFLSCGIAVGVGSVGIGLSDLGDPWWPVFSYTVATGLLAWGLQVKYGAANKASEALNIYYSKYAGFYDQHKTRLRIGVCQSSPGIGVCLNF
jgi:hypothetical protein